MNDYDETQNVPEQPQQPEVKQTASRKKKTLITASIIVLVVLIASVVALVLIRSSNRSEGDTATNLINAAQANFKYKVAVSVTDDGFVPSTLTIDKSTQLTFQNNGSTKHSIVADGDTLKTEPTLGLKNGETSAVTLPSGNYSSYYNYTFQNPGTYHVHDGFNPTSNLTVIVQ